MYFSVHVKSVCILCLLTSVSGYRTGSFKKPIEGSLWVLSDKKHNHKRLLDTVFTTTIYNEARASIFTLLYVYFTNLGIHETGALRLDKEMGCI